MNYFKKFTAGLTGVLLAMGIPFIAVAADNADNEIPEIEAVLNYMDTDGWTVESIHNGYPAKDYGMTDIPSSYIPDIKELPDVRNQNPYGTCWAHSSIALAELSILKHENKSMDLSELHLAYFTYNSDYDPIGGTEGDYVVYKESDSVSLLNTGGNLKYSSKAFAAWKGAALEENCSYELAAFVNSNEYTPDKSIEYEDAAHLKYAYFIDTENDKDEIKKYVIENGGVGISYAQYYKYYNSTYKSYYNNVDTSTNHAVTIVGWDDDFPKENFGSTAPGNGAWLIRNSWGVTDYCMSGYFWLSYYDTSISKVAFAFNFVSSESEEFYDNNYQYDGGLFDSLFTGKIMVPANVFTCANDFEELKAVGFETKNANLDYTIKIYKGITSADNPESGILVSTKTGSTSFEGIYTVKLDTPVILKKGDVYSVVIYFSSPSGTNVSIPFDYSQSLSWIDSNCSAKEGQSFLKSDMFLWFDLGAEFGNLRIKAFTDNVEYSFASDIIINNSTIEIKQGNNYQVDYRLYPENAMDDITWSSSNTNVASVSSAGVISAVGVGEAVIECKGENITKTINVTVLPKNLGLSGSRDEKNNYSLQWNDIRGALKITGTGFDGSDIVIFSAEDVQQAEYCVGNTGNYKSYTVSIDKQNVGYWEETILIEPENTTITEITLTEGGIKIEFAASQSAEKYIIQRKNPNDDNWTEIAVIAYDCALSYTDTTVTNNTEYCYRVYTVNGDLVNITDESSKIRYYVSGWYLSDGKWYYLDNDGIYLTGWNRIDNKWYYMNADGTMVTGWMQDGGRWYYLNNSGVMVTGWNRINNKWYYMNGNGAMVTGWVLDNGKWYYMNGNGAMVTGWVWNNGKWYYMNGSGAMVTGWVQDNGKWYYLEAGGTMAVNKWINNIYYVKSDGSMAVSEWVDDGRYYVGADGKWVPNKKK